MNLPPIMDADDVGSVGRVAVIAALGAGVLEDVDPAFLAKHYAEHSNAEYARLVTEGVPA